MRGWRAEGQQPWKEAGAEALREMPELERAHGVVWGRVCTDEAVGLGFCAGFLHVAARDAERLLRLRQAGDAAMVWHRCLAAAALGSAISQV